MIPYQNRVPVYWGTSFDSTSSRIYIHFAQLILSKRFCEFDFGPLENLATYGQSIPPAYPLYNITFKDIYLFNGLNDLLADKTDVHRLATELPSILIMINQLLLLSLLIQLLVYIYRRKTIEDNLVATLDTLGLQFGHP